MSCNARGRRSRHGRGRVSFEGNEPRVYQWQCDPDLHKVRSPEREVLSGFDATDSLQNAVIRLQSAEGHVFEAPGSLFVASPVIHQLVNDSGPDEDIPLPCSTSRGLSTFLDLCRWHSKLPSAETPAMKIRDYVTVVPGQERNTLIEVLWVIKLLSIEHVACRYVAELMILGVFGDRPFRGIPSDSLLPVLMYGGVNLSQELLIELIRILTDRVSPGYESAVVNAVVPHLGHPSEEIRQVALECLEGLRTIDAQVVLLKHRCTSVRLSALKSMPGNCANGVESVVPLTRDCSFQVREVAAQALANMAPWGNRIAIESLVLLLEDRVREVREAAVSGLVRVAMPDDPPTIALITPLAMHENLLTRCAALRVLAEISSGNQEFLQYAVEEIQAGSDTMAKLLGARLLKSMQTCKPAALSDDDDSTEDDSDEQSDHDETQDSSGPDGLVMTSGFSSCSTGKLDSVANPRGRIAERRPRWDTIED